MKSRYLPSIIIVLLCINLILSIYIIYCLKQDKTIIEETDGTVRISENQGLSKNSSSLAKDEYAPVELSLDNYDQYIHIAVYEDLRGKFTTINNYTYYNAVGYKAVVQGNVLYHRYEDVEVTVKIILKAKGYDGTGLKEANQSMENEYIIKLLEKGNTEDSIHELVEYDDFWTCQDDVFVDYEVLDVSGRVIRMH